MRVDTLRSCLVCLLTACLATPVACQTPQQLAQRQYEERMRAEEAQRQRLYAERMRAEEQQRQQAAEQRRSDDRREALRRRIERCRRLHAERCRFNSQSPMS